MTGVKTVPGLRTLFRTGRGTPLPRKERPGVSQLTLAGCPPRNLFALRTRPASIRGGGAAQARVTASRCASTAHPSLPYPPHRSLPPSPPAAGLSQPGPMTTIVARRQLSFCPQRTLHHRQRATFACLPRYVDRTRTQVKRQDHLLSALNGQHRAVVHVVQLAQLRA